jgi:hypothetical protein
MTPNNQLSKSQRLPISSPALGQQNLAYRNMIERETNKEKLMRLEKNKEALDKVWDEIIVVTNQMRFCKDEGVKKKLEERFRVLKNKYASSHGIDEIIEHI